MELMSLDPTFQPLNPIENYASLVWAERYSSTGDFVLVGNNITELVNLMPLESYVSLRDSTIPMVVESHKPVNPKNDTPSIEIRGRSFNSVLERRGSVNIPLPAGSTRLPWIIEASKESDAAYLAMRIVLGDVARVQGSTTVLPVTPPVTSSLDAIPQIDLTLPADYVDVLNILGWSAATAYASGDKVKSGGFVWRAIRNHTNVTPSLAATTTWVQESPYASYEIKPQNLLTTVLELININHRGIKAVRSLTGGTKVGVEIYNGVNLTGLYTLDAHFDQIDAATYLLSKQGSANVAYVYGSGGSQVVLKTAAAEPSGLERRVLVVDQSSDATTGGASAATIRRTRGLIELYKYNVTALFDGEVAEQVALGYNRDYFLGDILQLVGEYGLIRNVRVAEYIRSEDSGGEKAYPTFEAVDD
jgi:hypothetical protein